MISSLLPCEMNFLKVYSNNVDKVRMNLYEQLPLKSHIKFKGWDRIRLADGLNDETMAIAPVIVSASRATDIPGFHAEWFIDAIDRGHVMWINPFNRRSQAVSFEKTRVIVFWTKNPEPLLPYLHHIDRKGVHYYFQFTLNDYEREGFEPHVPPVEKRIDTFRRLSELIGKERVIWRFDPLILTDRLRVNGLLEKIRKLGDRLHNYTEKLVISFVDIDKYRKVRNHFRHRGVAAHEFEMGQIEQIAQGLQTLNHSWQLDIATCAETADLHRYGISHNRCIDDALMIRMFPHDSQLMSFLGYREGMSGCHEDRTGLKDKGQRKTCGCIVSKDIGRYDTCGHGCIYCYANSPIPNAVDNDPERSG
jgi:DNA repair photolyase